MDFPICIQCNKYPAISPEGICNICDEKALVKRSEQLRQEANSLDSDLAYLGAMKKVLRQERFERFADLEEAIKNSGKVTNYYFDELNQKALMETPHFGVVGYFPKANKIHIHKGNKWIKPGLKWLHQNIIDHEKKD